MVNLTIRNIPEEILKRIRIFAAKERRSLNSELLIVIENGLAARISDETGGEASLHGHVVSSAGRKRMWDELCGTWKDDREFSTLRDTIFSSRDKGRTP